MDKKTIQRDMLNARDEYIDIIKRELMGPGSELVVPDAEHELISSSPNSRYTIGILFPKGSITMQDNDETEVSADESTSEEDNTEQNAYPDANKVNNTITTDRISEDWDDDSSDNLDEEVGMASQFKPSSMGVTFLVHGDCTQIRCDVEFATYRKATVADCVVPFSPDDPDNYTVPTEFISTIVFDKEKSVLRLISQLSQKEICRIIEKDTLSAEDLKTYRPIAYRLADFLKSGYVRVPHKIEDVILDFSAHDYIKSEDATALDETIAKVVGLRKKIKNNIWSVTVMLLNDFEEEREKPEHCLYQAKITVSSEKNNFVFTESHTDYYDEHLDDEEKSLELLYRNKKIYGTGLGTAVDWHIDNNGIGALWSDFFPVKEIPGMRFSLPQNDLLRDEELSMKYLSDLDTTPKSEKLASLKRLVDLYHKWVDSLEITAKSLNARYTSAAMQNITECRKAYTRMYAGIRILDNNDNAYHAFLLANRAMFMQRIHIHMQETMSEDHYEDNIQVANFLNTVDYQTEDDSMCRWRPFQIAFLLMDIDSIVNEQSNDRNLVDLIWFPTGGGKTEAYLGLTAFTIFYRKMAHLTESNGTTVIMRYTLRLLAAQQFTRAATLICACEYIRQDCELKKSRRNKYPAYPLGSDPITIGLWIGGIHIPNKNDKAKEHLGKLINASEAFNLRNLKDKHNKFQVLKCPWCGTKMVKDVIDSHSNAIERF